MVLYTRCRQQFVRQSQQLVRDGFWVLPDALEAIQRAVRSDVP